MKYEFSLFEFFCILKKQLLVLLRRLLKLLIIFFKLENLYVAYSKEVNGFCWGWGDGILRGLLLETDKEFFLFKGITIFLRGSVADLFWCNTSFSFGFLTYFSNEVALFVDSMSAFEQSLHLFPPLSNLCSLRCSYRGFCLVSFCYLHFANPSQRLLALVTLIPT